MPRGRPLQPTQGTNPHAPRPKLSKEARAALRAQQAGKNKAYNRALDDASKAISNIIENVAVSHNKSLQRIESTLHMGRDSITNAHREKSSAWNGFSKKVLQERRAQGLPIGKDAMKIVASHKAEYNALTAEERDELVRGLEEAKAIEKKSRRTSNKSKGLDITHTIRKITGELENLKSRTGMETMLVAVRGSSNQTTDGVSFATEGVAEFLPTAMGIDQQDFASRMEGFAFNGIRGSAKNYKQRSNSLRKDIRDLMQKKLVEAADDEDARMHWSKYWELVVVVHRVIIEGWPETMAFANLSTVSKSIADLEELHRRWKTGKTRWRRISDEEFEKMDQERTEKINKGELKGPRRRQTRSDKGIKRRHQGDDSGRKRRRTTGKSREVISDSDGGSDEERDGGNADPSRSEPSNFGHPSASASAEANVSADTLALPFGHLANFNVNSENHFASNGNDTIANNLTNYDPAADPNFDDENFLLSLPSFSTPLATPVAFDLLLPPSEPTFNTTMPQMMFDWTTFNTTMPQGTFNIPDNDDASRLVGSNVTMPLGVWNGEG